MTVVSEGPVGSRKSDAFAQEMGLLSLLIGRDADKIALKADHVLQTRRLPRDCLRNAERLEDHVTQLQTHVRQMIRHLIGEIRDDWQAEKPYSNPPA